MKAGMSDRWAILQTSSARTLPLATSLAEADMRVWTPRRTIWRPAPGQRRRLALGLRRDMVEVDVPIMPGFVFADADYLDDLVRVALSPATCHPAFSIFQCAGRAPLVGDASIAGLRSAEADAAIVAENYRDSQSRDSERRARAEQMRTDRARRKALRSQRKDFAVGERVAVIDMPAMAGMIGTVVKSNGATAMVSFGAWLTMNVEAWRVIPSALLDGEPYTGIAA